MDETFKNRAKMLSDKPEHVTCDFCPNPLVFAMRDNYHDFSIDLLTVLRCLKIAESEHVIPELPNDWWIHIKQAYMV
jgi:hypothetical protein